jgi:hypothetical protein
MMTYDETMIINNMTNVIKNLEHSKRICDIIEDLNELISTLRDRNHDIIDEPERLHSQAYASEPVKAVTVTVVTPVQIKAETVTKVESLHSQAYVSEPVQKQTKKTPGRGKFECRCGLMICSAAMTRHEKGAKHKEAMAKKQKTEMKQTEGQTLGMSDMDLVDIDTYMKVMLPRLYKKVRGLGGQVHNNETFGFMKFEGTRDKMIDIMYNIVMPDFNRKVLCNMLLRKFDELMNSSKKYNRYVNILNKSFEAYQTKNKYVYFLIISKSNEVYLTTYERLHSQAYASEPKQIEENLDVYDEEKIIEVYENEKDFFDEEIKKITKSNFWIIYIIISS